MGFFTKKATVERSYAIGEQLGEGNFAVVKRATAKKGNGQVAIKIIDKSKVESMEEIQREIEIMQMVKHKNVIQLVEIFDEPKKMFLVMELVTGGELFDRIVSKGSYTEKDAAETIRSICEALGYLHKLKIVHRDLKPENILYASEAEDAEIKIADFGLARVVSSKDIMRTACGTPGYVAPEILRNQGYSSGAVDMWSVGVILYILLCGFPPFYEDELPALFEQILQARYDFPSPWWDTISPAAKELVKSLLKLNPEERMSADQVLASGWIREAGDANLDGAKKLLRRHNALRKLKKAANGIIAKQKLENALKALRAAQAAAPAEA